jgi:hypothetical protein
MHAESAKQDHLQKEAQLMAKKQAADIKQLQAQLKE